MTHPDSDNPFRAPQAPRDEDPHGVPALDGQAPFLTPRTGVITALYLCVAMSVATILGMLLQVYLINLDSPSMSVLEASDTINGTVAVVSFIVLIAAVVTWGQWAYRAAANLRAMAPQQVFQYTPASQVWWHFVPLMNLVQPVVAMKEVWSTSAEASGRAGLPFGPVHRWWGAWLVSNVLSNLAFRFMPDPNDVSSTASYFDQLTASSGLTIIAELLSILAAFLAVAIVQGINAHQTDWARSR